MWDDILIIWEQEDSEFDRFYCYLMAIAPQFKFTVESEQNGVLIYIDIYICREQDKFMTKVYQKDTHTNRY